MNFVDFLGVRSTIFSRAFYFREFREQDLIHKIRELTKGNLFKNLEEETEDSAKLRACENIFSSAMHEKMRRS